MQSEYDVVIVGAGPAGILAAMEIVERAEIAGKSLQVAIIERGNHIENRSCPSQVKGGPCQKCNPCRVMCGWGGSGALSDGKLNLSTELGGWLTDFLPKDEVMKLIKEADDVFLKFGAPKDRLFDPFDNPEITDYRRKALAAGVELVLFPTRHIGTENTGKILLNMYNWLLEKGVKVFLETKVKSIQIENGG